MRGFCVNNMLRLEDIAHIMYRRAESNRWNRMKVNNTAGG